MILCCVGVWYIVGCSIHGLYSSDASSSPLSLTIVSTKMSPDMAKCLMKDRNQWPPIDKHWCRWSPRTRCGFAYITSCQISLVRMQSHDPNLTAKEAGKYSPVVCSGRRRNGLGKNLKNLCHNLRTRKQNTVVLNLPCHVPVTPRSQAIFQWKEELSALL